MQLGQLWNSFGAGVTCPRLHSGCCGEEGAAAVPLQRANIEALTGQAVWVGCSSSPSPLQGSVCRKGPVWSHSSNALGCVVTLSRVLAAPQLQLPSFCLSACCPVGSWDCRDARTSSQALKSQRALVHPIKECQVIPLCS